MASLAASLCILLPGVSQAQFTTGTALTAPALNAAFATKADKVGGGSQIMVQQPGTGTVARTLSDKFSDVINGRDYGMKCDGVTNDDAAMTAAFADIKPFTQLVLPPGRCLFSTPKVLPTVSNASLVGAGVGQTWLVYTGPAGGTSDLITLGDGTTSLSGWLIKGFSGLANNAQSGGAFLHLKRMQNGNMMTQVSAPSRNLYNGVWLDNVNVFYYTDFNISVQNAGLMMNGSATSDEGSDIFLDNGSITFSHIAYWVGGGMGGVYYGKTLAYGNGTSYQIDNGLAARLNREFFFSESAVSDGPIDYGLYINDTLTSNAPIVMNGAIGSAGVLNASGKGVNIYVKSWPNGRITIGPGQSYNATHDNLLVDDASTIISIDPARHIFNNGGYGINATVPTTNIGNYSQYQSANALGNMSANVNPVGFNSQGDIHLQGTPGKQRGINWWENGIRRWRFTTDGSAEGGSNAGGNFVIGRYDDSGNYLGAPIQITRSSGGVVVNGPLSITSTIGFSDPVAAARSLSVNQGLTGAITRPLPDKVEELMTPQDYGAQCNGATDDTVALQAWLNAITPSKGGQLISGNCVFTSTLTLANANNKSIIGTGQSSVLTYSGASTTSDLLQFGDGNSLQANLTVSGIRVQSTTKMTAGAAFHFIRQGYAHLSRLYATGISGNNDGATATTHNNLYTSFWFDGAHMVFLNSFNAFGTGDGILVNDRGGDGNVNLFVSDGYADYNGGAGVHMAGGFGGLFLSNMEIMGNYTAGFMQDQAQVNEPNRETIIGDDVSLDGLGDHTPYLIYINETGSLSELQSDAFAGSATQATVYIKSMPQGYVKLGGKLLNSTHDGVQIDDATTRVHVESQMIKNAGYGINATVPTNNVVFTGQAADNTSGNWNANAHIAGTGYSKDNKGRICFWGQTSLQVTSAGSSATSTVTFPYAFPNAADANDMQVTLSSYANGTQIVVPMIQGVSTTQAQVGLISTAAMTNPQSVNWRVCGN